MGAEESFWQGGPRESLTQQNSPPPLLRSAEPDRLQRSLPPTNLIAICALPRGRRVRERPQVGWFVWEKEQGGKWKGAR